MSPQLTLTEGGGGEQSAGAVVPILGGPSLSGDNVPLSRVQ